MRTWRTLGRAALDRDDAGPALPVIVWRRDTGYTVFHERRPGNFLDTTPCRTPLARRSSATIFLSHVFKFVPSLDTLANAAMT